MKLNVAVQMDPIERISIRGDSTFALLLEAQKRGHGLSYYTPDKLSLNGEELVAPVQLLTVRDEPGDHFTLGEPRREPLTAFDVILLRQDPPFDLAYITSTHFLERLHPKTLVVNDPAGVRNAPEKLFVMDFPKLMPPTLISRDLDEINAFRDARGAAKATELTPREREICETLGPALRERGLLFVGIDVIDGNLTEINVTSPTGIRAIARLGGPDVAAKIWDVIEKKRG